MISKNKVLIIVIASFLALAGCAKNNGFYSFNTLENKIGNFDKYSSRDFTIGKEDCVNYWYAGPKINNGIFYDECDYYIFDNNRSASKAFDFMKKNWIDNETDSGNNYVQGWEKGVCDASLEIYIHLTENMIITTYVQETVEWGTPDDIDAQTESETSKINMNSVDFIKNNF